MGKRKASRAQGAYLLRRPTHTRAKPAMPKTRAQRNRDDAAADADAADADAADAGSASDDDERDLPAALKEARQRFCTQLYFTVVVLLIGVPLAFWHEYVPRGGGVPDAAAAGDAYGEAMAAIESFVPAATLRIAPELSGCEDYVKQALAGVRHLRWVDEEEGARDVVIGRSLTPEGPSSLWAPLVSCGLAPRGETGDAVATNRRRGDGLTLQG